MVVSKNMCDINLYSVITMTKNFQNAVMIFEIFVNFVCIEHKTTGLIYKPSVVGAVLQSPPLLIDWIRAVEFYIFTE